MNSFVALHVWRKDAEGAAVVARDLNLIRNYQGKVRERH
jgi:hypothetical protein